MSPSLETHCGVPEIPDDRPNPNFTLATLSAAFESLLQLSFQRSLPVDCPGFVSLKLYQQTFQLTLN